MVDKIIRHFYDSHPNLPLDPDSEQLALPQRAMHTRPSHILVVGVGAFLAPFVAMASTGLFPRLGPGP